MSKREKVQIALFVFVAIGTALAQIASMAHMVEAFGWANSSGMALFLSVVTVILSAVFIALAVITPPGRPRTAIMWGIGLLLVTEWAGNIGVGGLMVNQRMPQGIATFFGLETGVADRIAAFLLSGFLPVLVFIAVYAITESANTLMEPRKTSPLAKQILHDFDHSASALEQAEQVAARHNGANHHEVKGV